MNAASQGSGPRLHEMLMGHLKRRAHCSGSAIWRCRVRLRARRVFAQVLRWTIASPLFPAAGAKHGQPTAQWEVKSVRRVDHLWSSARRPTPAMIRAKSKEQADCNRAYESAGRGCSCLLTTPCSSLGSVLFTHNAVKTKYLLSQINDLLEHCGSRAGLPGTWDVRPSLKAEQIEITGLTKTERGLIMSRSKGALSRVDVLKKRKWEKTDGAGARQNKQSKQVWRELAGVTGFSKTFQSLRNKRPCERTGAETRGL